MTLSQSLKRRVDLGIRDRDLDLLDLNPEIVLDLDFRFYLDHGRKRKPAAFLQLIGVDLRARHDLKAALFDRFA